MTGTIYDDFTPYDNSAPRRPRMRPIECQCWKATGGRWCGMLIKQRRNVKRLTINGTEVVYNRMCINRRAVGEAWVRAYSPAAALVAAKNEARKIAERDDTAFERTLELSP